MSIWHIILTILILPRDLIILWNSDFQTFLIVIHIKKNLITT